MVAGQVQAGPIFVFSAQHRLFANHKVLENFAPANAEVSFQEVGAAVNKRAQGAAPLHLPMDVAFDRPSPFQELLLGEALGKPSAYVNFGHCFRAAKRSKRSTATAAI